MNLAHILITFLVLFLSVLGAELHIKEADELIIFSCKVNSGVTSYSGTTVYLDTDIDFSGKSFDVIGKSYDDDSYFQGTFDGQGHIISNLNIESSSPLAGLFGFSEGLTIKNVVVDGTCSVTSSYSLSDVDVGGIIGFCYAESSNCIIENIVNMGNVSFNGIPSRNDFGLYLGGIAGSFGASYSFESCLKNCANYGTISNYGTAFYFYIGGISGVFFDGYIQNSLNYGVIIHNVTTISKDHSIGGIIGAGINTINENCVSAGIITNSEPNGHVGSIIGYVDSSSLKYCFWTNNVGYNNSYGNGSFISIDESSLVTINPALLKELNTYSSENGWNNWTMLHMNDGKINNINQEYLVINNKFLPDSEKENFTFVGWFKDSAFSEKYDPKETSTPVDVYAKFTAVYTVSFNATGGKVEEQTKDVYYNEKYGKLPNATRDGYTFDRWFTEEGGKGEKITQNAIVSVIKDHTLYANWIINSYTVSFDFNNGTTVNVMCEYNKNVLYPEDTDREGYTFIGWFTDKDYIIPFDDSVITEDITLYAKYEEIKVVDSSSNKEKNNVNQCSNSFSSDIAPLSTLISFLLCF